MLTSGLQALAVWVVAQLVSAQQDQAPQSTGCGDIGEGSFGGVVSCIPISTTTVQPSQATGCGDVGEGGFGGVPGCIAKSTADSVQSVTVLPLVGTITGQDSLPSTVTSSVSWSFSDIAVTITTDGQTQQTTTPVWVCIGDLCNPKCKKSDQCDNSDNGGIGPLGFPWPPAPPSPPVENTPSGDNSGGDTSGGDNSGGNTPGGESSGGDSSSGKDGDGDDGEGDEDQTTSTTGISTCVQTQIACTQICTVSSAAGSPSPTTLCPEAQVCRRQAGDGCTSTTGTTTTTSFTTISATPLICSAGSCGCGDLGSQIQNIAPAVTTNDPGDKIPSITDAPNSNQKVKRSSRITRVDKIIKRVNQNDPTSIRQTDFTDPNTFLQGGRLQWFKNAVALVERDGPRNAVDSTGGIASSTWFDYSDLRNHAITTGSGPSWGCTSVLVFSERGAWIAHFWEREQIQNDAKFASNVINFIRVGSGDGKYLGLVDVVPRIFSGPIPGGDEEGELVEEPVFAFAIIFTPSFRTSDVIPDGKQATDAIYGDQVDQIKTVLINQLPGFTVANSDQKILVATYQPVDFEAQMDAAPWLGLLTFEYVPQHTWMDPDTKQCKIVRAIRIWRQDQIMGIFPFSWPDQTAASGSSKKHKRDSSNEGSCPANFPDILNNQGNGAAEPSSVYEVGAPVTTAAISTNTLPSDTSPETTMIAPITIAQPSSTSAPMCSNWQLSPNGVQVGTNCDGDPNKTVTVTAFGAKRAISTAF